MGPSSTAPGGLSSSNSLGQRLQNAARQGFSSVTAGTSGVGGARVPPAQPSAPGSAYHDDTEMHTRSGQASGPAGHAGGPSAQAAAGRGARNGPGDRLGGARAGQSPAAASGAAVARWADTHGPSSHAATSAPSYKPSRYDDNDYEEHFATSSSSHHQDYDSDPFARPLPPTHGNGRFFGRRPSNDLQSDRSDRYGTERDLYSNSRGPSPASHMAAAVSYAPPPPPIDDDFPTPPAGGGDRFTALPPMRLKKKTSMNRIEAVTIAPRALQSPPPHERIDISKIPVHDDHESAMSGSASSGATAFSTAHASAFRQPLNSSTSTAMTAATTASSSTLGGDEMLMALLASQAAVDCDALPIGAWDDVESWKKELSLLSTRLEALQARHQREVKILTAARTLQKLNQSNKRMSKQTMDSLEQSEKRVQAAEKEVLVLRDREAALRRQLMEHWAGVMAWEVRRLERSASEASARYDTQVSAVETARNRLAELEENAPQSQDREQEFTDRVGALERDLATERDQSQRRVGRVSELEELVLEFGRRERALEDDAKRDNDNLAGIEEDREQERQQWQQHRDQWDAERARLVAERDELHAHRSQLESQTRDMGSSRDAWGAERDQLISERDRLHADRIELENITREHATQRETWVTQHDQLVAEHNKLMAERNDLVADQERLESSLRDHESSKGTWTTERDMLHAKTERLQADLVTLAAERDGLHTDAQNNAGGYESERSAWMAERDALLMEKEQLSAERDLLSDERTRLTAAAESTSTLTRGTTERLSSTLSGVLGRNVSEAGVLPALEEVVAIIDQRDSEVNSLKEELREVSDGLEEEVRRVNADRDRWKAKAEDAAVSQRGVQTEMTELVRKIRAQNDQVNNLTAQLQGDPGSRDMSSVSTNPVLESKATTLEAELSNITDRLTKLWVILPTPRARAEAGLMDPGVVSPNSVVDFAALQRAYAGPTNKERYAGIDDLVSRVRDIVDDGRLMVERMARMETDKERHKANAAKAAQLVDHSRDALATYQNQVAELQERIERRDAEEVGNTSRNAGSTAELNQLITQVETLRNDLDDAMAHNSRLEDEVFAKEDAIKRLNDVNSSLSARTLTLAEDAENDKRALSTRLQSQIDVLKKQTEEATQAAAKAKQDAEAERGAGSLQMTQLMDELNSLQEEVQNLRTKLRAKGG